MPLDAWGILAQFFIERMVNAEVVKGLLSAVRAQKEVVKSIILILDLIRRWSLSDPQKASLCLEKLQGLRASSSSLTHLIRQQRDTHSQN